MVSTRKPASPQVMKRTLWFQLENSWDYATGTYSQTAIYTLVSY